MSGIEPLLFGAAASGTTAATAGLLGSAGAFGWAQTLSTLGTAFGALSAVQGARSQAASDSYNAQLQERNAQIARQNAEAEASREKRLAMLRMGTLRANAGASGGGVAGSALDLLSDNALEDALTIATIKQQGGIKAQGFEGTAALDRLHGKSAIRNGFVGAGSTLLLGSAKTMSM